MKRRAGFREMILAVTLSCSGGSAAAAGWSITDLGPLTGAGTDIAINDNGWVVSGSRVFIPGPGGYSSVQLLNAGGLDSSNLSLRGVNNANVVVGVDNSIANGQGFVWTQAGGRIDLPRLASYNNILSARVGGINDSGQVVGNTGDTAVIWSPNGSGGYGIVKLGVTGSFGSFVGSGEGVAINAAGAGLIAQVYPTYRTGYSTGVDQTTIIGAQGIYTPIGAAINDRFEVAGGGSYNCAGYSCDHAMIWQGSSVTYLDVVRADGNPLQNSQALALNEKGQVVGSAWYAPYDLRAVVWSAGTGGWSVGTPLDTLLPAGLVLMGIRARSRYRPVA